MPHDVGGLGKETGWIGRWAFQKDAISADAIGRQAVADGALTAQMVGEQTENNLNIAKVGKWTYDFAVQGGVVGSLILTGVALPAKAVVFGGMMEVITPVTGGALSTGALQIEAANDLINAIIVAGAPWSTAGRKALIPVWTAASAVITSVATRKPTAVAAVTDWTAGKFNVFLFYFVTD